MNKKILGFSLILATYFISTGASYALFSQETKKEVVVSPPVSTQKGLAFDDSLPKTESCPLNGAMYSKQQREWWEEHRPLGVMIENHEESRPQSGLSSADVVYEAVAEGGITRFLAVFYCQDAKHIGPVRSARTYFLDLISEYGESPLYAHVGGANTPGPANALGQIEQYGWVSGNDLNQFSIGFPTFWRDYERTGHEVATEHTMYSTTSKLWDFAAKSRKLSNVDEEGVAWDKTFEKYIFKDDEVLAKRPASQTIHIEHWEGYGGYAVDWNYDRATNTYKRENGGKPHLDKNNDKQLTAKTIVALFTTERSANDGYENNLHLLYKTKGSGEARIFTDGIETKGTWKKADRTSKTKIYDASGNPLSFNKGTMWFHILPTEGIVDVK